MRLYNKGGKARERRKRRTQGTNGGRYDLAQQLGHVQGERAREKETGRIITRKPNNIQAVDQFGIITLVSNQPWSKRWVFKPTTTHPHQSQYYTSTRDHQRQSSRADHIPSCSNSTEPNAACSEMLSSDPSRYSGFGSSSRRGSYPKLTMSVSYGMK